MSMAASTFESLESRYNGAYKVAQRIISCGSIAEGVGIAFGIVIVILGIVEISAGASDGIATILFGICVGFAGYVAGIVLATGGQIMSAAIDTAVNTSTLISNDEKAKIIGIGSAQPSPDGKRNAGWAT